VVELCVVYLFFLWRLFDFAIAFVIPRFIPYLGFFPYGEILKEYGLPQFVSAFANFDGAQYLTLVREGYNTYTQAYFPLYFLLVRLFSFFLPTPHSPRPYNDLLSGLIVSNGFFAVGVFVFKKYLSLILPNKSNSVFWTVLFLFIFPTSFFFGAVYTEGLFFFLFVLSLFFLKKKKYPLAGICAGLCSATRLMGVFLVVPFTLHFLDSKTLVSWKRALSKYKFKKKHLVILSPFAGLGLYMTYLWVTVGDPLFFFNAQPVFGANRSTNIIFLPQVIYRYLKIFLTARFNFQYAVSLLEFVIFSFVLILLVADLFKHRKNTDRLGLSLFSFINLLLPTLTGTLSSIPRYALFSISLFLFLGEINNKFVKCTIAFVFFLLHAVLLGFFVQGYFIG